MRFKINIFSLVFLCVAVLFSIEAFAQIVPLQVDSTKTDSSKMEFIMPKIYVEKVPRRRADHCWLAAQLTSTAYHVFYGEKFPQYDLLLIDPQGGKLGCDSTQAYSEIIGGEYEKTYDYNDDGSDYPVIKLYVENPKPGNYTLQIYSKKYDCYTLTIHGADWYHMYAINIFDAINSYENEVHEYSFIWLDRMKIKPNGVSGFIEFTKIPEIVKEKMR